MRRRIATALALAGALAGLVPSLSVEAAKQTYIRRISARAMNLSLDGDKTYRVEIGIVRWSTDDERETLLQAVKDGGTGTVTAALQQQPDLGFVRFGSATQTIRYAKEFPDGKGGATVFLATDRPLGFREVQLSLRTKNYTVSLAKLELDVKGKGEGEIAPYSELAWNEQAGRIDVGNYALQPYRLSGLRWKNPQ